MRQPQAEEYSENRCQSNPTPANLATFTITSREDDGTGLLYYRARYYDPSLEMCISQAPLGDAQRYVNGNPLLFTDPLGLLEYLQIQIGNPYGNPNGMASHIDASTANSIGGAPSDTKVVQVNSIQGFQQALRTYKPTEALILSGHGSTHDIDRLLNAGNLSEAFSPFSEPGMNSPGRIEIFGCNTGKEAGSIAEKISNLLPGTAVSAPPDLILMLLNFGGNNRRTFLNQNQPLNLYPRLTK